MLTWSWFNDYYIRVLSMFYFGVTVGEKQQALFSVLGEPGYWYLFFSRWHDGKGRLQSRGLIPLLSLYQFVQNSNLRIGSY